MSGFESSQRLAAGYVDPFEERNYAPREYSEKERDMVNRGLLTVARIQLQRPGYEPTGPRRVRIDGPIVKDGPFAGFTCKLERLLRPHNAVREVIAVLGPRREVSAERLRVELETCGAFFLESSDGGEELYSMSSDPPESNKPIEDETFDIDDESLEAIVQERLRVAVKLAPTFSYRFYFV